MKNLELREDGDELWANVEWTPDGADAIKNKEYRFVSPSFVKDHTHKNGDKIGTTLLAAAITNHPFLEGMKALTLYNFAAIGDLAMSDAAAVPVVNLMDQGQRVMIAPGNARTQDEVGGTFEVAEVVGDGDDSFASLKDGAGQVHKWFRATELLPASNTPAGPPHPGLPTPASTATPGAPAVPAAAAVQGTPLQPGQMQLPIDPATGLPQAPSTPPPVAPPIDPTTGVPAIPGAAAMPAAPGAATPAVDPAVAAAHAIAAPVHPAAVAAAGAPHAAGPVAGAPPVHTPPAPPAAPPHPAAVAATPHPPVAPGAPPHPAAGAPPTGGIAPTHPAAAPVPGGLAPHVPAPTPGAKPGPNDDGAVGGDTAKKGPPPPAKPDGQEPPTPSVMDKTAPGTPPAPAAPPAIDPTTGLPIDPATGLPVNPNDPNAHVQAALALLKQHLQKGGATPPAATPPAATKGINMKFMLRTDDQKEIEITAEQLAAAGVKIIPEGHVAIDAAQLTTMAEQITNLSTKVTDMETATVANAQAASLVQLNAELDRLSRGGYILKPTRDLLYTQFKDTVDLSGFKALAATFTKPLVAVGAVHGTSEDIDTETDPAAKAGQDLMQLSERISKERGISLRDATIAAGAQMRDAAEVWRNGAPSL
jgi:hypothetical protein